MVSSNGVRVLHWLARRSLYSHVLQDSRTSMYRIVIGGGYRRYTPGIGNPVNLFGNQNPNIAHHRKSLLCGFLDANFTATRSIHGTISMLRDFYDVLGVSKNATDGEIKKAYYGLAKRLHPDMNKDDPEAEKKFQEVSKAYEVLKDKEKRDLYNQVGHEAFEQNANNGYPNEGGFGGGFNPFDIFSNFNGGDIFNMFRRDIDGQDVKLSLELSFMEAVQGCTKNISFQTEVPCEACGGLGVPPGEKRERCKTCNGLGMTTWRKGILTVQRTCPKCGGAGQAFSSVCRSCEGAKVVSGQKTVKLDIMPGIDNDETIKVHRGGGADPDENQPGDLYVTIKVREDPVFRREGADIHVDAVLNITQAILGGTVQVPTLSGDVVVKVRPGTQPGQKVVLRNKGIKSRNPVKSFGDQYVHFNISIPTNLTRRQLELIEEFAKEERGECKGAAAEASS